MNPETSYKIIAIEERSLSRLMELAIKPYSMELYLQETLSLIVNLPPYFNSLPMAAIFITELVNDKQKLKLIAKHNLSPALNTLCAEINFGYCLCGRAAEQKKIQFSKSVDERHEIRFEGMNPNYGNYNIPLISGGVVVGVLALYLKERHQSNKREIPFLKRISSILGQGITQRKTLEKLKKSYQKIQVDNSVNSNYMAKMSQELLTPMNAISGMTDHLLGIKQNPLDKQLKILKLSANHLNKLIKNILEYSKYGKNHFVITSKRFSFDEFMTNYLSELRIAVENKGIFFRVHVDKSIPSALKGDLDKLEQVISILADNAIKYTKSGEIGVSIDTKKENAKSILIHFSINDTGMGISNKQQEGLFHEFNLSSNSASRKLGSSGLGLPLAKKLVELLTGEIWLERKSGPGSLFNFTAKFNKLEQSDQENSVESTLTMEIINILSLKDKSEPQVISESDNKIIRPLIIQLYDMVNNYDMESDGVVKKLLPILKMSTHKKTFDAILIAVKKYDFNNAKILIKTLAKQLNINLPAS